MKLKTFTRRAAAAGAVLAALMLAALPALAAPKVQVNTTNAVADHADILSDETEQYVNDVSIKLSDACGAQIGVYTLDELLGSTTMEGFAYDVFNAWGLGSDDLDNGVLLLLAPNEADGGDYYIMRGDGLESQLSFSTLGSLLDEYMEPYWVNGDYDTGTQKTVQALANRLCSIYGVTLNSSYTDTSAPDRGGPNVMGFVLLVVAVLLVIKWIDPFAPRERPLPETPDWITVELLPLNEFSRPGTPLEEVNGIVIHYVGNPGTTAAQNHSFFTNLAQTGETYASSHFLVGLDGEVLQNVPLNEVAYCSNQRNDDTISIECCHPDDSGEFTSATYESLVRLTRWLMEEYGLDTSQVIRHYDVTGKLCPKAFVEHPEEWERFLRALEE
mgnify:FL=1